MTKKLRCNLVAEKLPELVAPFNIKLREDNVKFYGCCPIHGGDNNQALNVYKHGRYWQCHTHHCEEEWGLNIVCFIRALLSKYGKNAKYQDALKYIKGLTNIEEYSQLDNINDVFQNQEKVYERKINSACLKKLETPSTYYLDRGYSEKVLREYKIGICRNFKKPMFNRTVFPIFSSPSKKFITGCLGRSIFEKCAECDQFHAEGRCPQQNFNYVKWRNSAGLPRKRLLYNTWGAQESIKDTGVVVLVEGPGDALRMVEAGIPNCLAILGTKFTTGQMNELNKLGALNIILCFDNDQAGKDACKNIVQICKNTFSIEIPIQDKYKDIGDIPLDEIDFWKEIKKYAKS